MWWPMLILLLSTLVLYGMLWYMTDKAGMGSRILPPFISILMVFTIIGSSGYMVNLTQRKWLGHSECIDGETEVGNVIIKDCDLYYELDAVKGYDED